MGFSRQEYWMGCHFLLQGNLLNPGIESRSPALLADSLPFEPLGKPGKVVPVIINKDFLKQKCIHKHTHGVGDSEHERDIIGKITNAKPS